MWMDDTGLPLQHSRSVASTEGSEIAQADYKISDGLQSCLSGEENILAMSQQASPGTVRPAESAVCYIFSQSNCLGQVNSESAYQLANTEMLDTTGDATKHNSDCSVMISRANGLRVEPSVQEGTCRSPGKVAPFINMESCKDSECGNTNCNSNELEDIQSSISQSSERNLNPTMPCKAKESCKTTSLKEPFLCLLQEKEDLIKLIKNQNNFNSFENTDNAPNSQCKILTKYIFINKTTHHKAKKKKFGLLYKKGFKHFYKSKLLVRKKSNISKTQGDCPPVSMRASNLKANRRLDSRKSELTHMADKDLHGGDSVPVLANSSQAYARSTNKRKVLSLDQKVEIIRAIDRPDSSMVSVAEKYSISRSVLWKILKKKDDILSRYESGERVIRKRTKYSSDEEAKPDSEGDIHNDDDDWLKKDFSGLKKKMRLRNRKDLTLEEKVKVIQALEAPGTKITAMAKKFGVSVSSISRINKNKEFIMLRSSSGDSSSKSKRSRECKDPELDRVLLKWYKAMEKLQPAKKTSISNVLLKEKAHDLAKAMGTNYFPSDNWIIRWKNRHNLTSKVNMIHDRTELQRQDTVNINDILEEAQKHQVLIEPVRQEGDLRRIKKAEQLIICECCGVMTSHKKKKENQHLQGCPASSVRKDLTLEEKVQVVRALEEPGVKMIHLAKRYGISPSAISRIAKNRVDILARKASGLSNSQRKRDRGSKEPEVEKALCEWFKVQHEMGVHISGSMIREKARDIAHVMGKDFWPSESWVFRWRQRYNVSDMNAVLYADSEEDENNEERPPVSDIVKAEEGHTDDGSSDIKVSFGQEITSEGASVEVESQGKKKEKKVGERNEKKCRLPRSVMCEKCGFVSCRLNNSRVKTLRHAKGCPDMKPRHELTYETRAKMLKALEESGATLSSVARQFGVSVSSMSRINANKERILNHCLDHSDQKRIRFCKEPEVAQSLYRWYMEKKSEGVHVTGPKLKEAARKMAAEMGRDFKASSGWLGRWRQRYNIVNSLKNSDNDNGESPKKKKNKKVQPTSESIDQMVNFQPMVSETHQDSLGSSASLILEQNVQHTEQQNQQPPVFLHQHFSTPWEMTQQQTGSCVWTKDFLSPSMGVGQEDPGLGVTFAYPNDGIPKPLFHNMFESFQSVSYQVAMPMEGAMLTRDFLKPDNNVDKVGHSTSLIPQTIHAVTQHRHQLSANLAPHASLQHHMASSQVHAPQHPPPPHCHQQRAELSANLPPPPSPSPMDDDPDQQRQVMEAFKIMNSFVQKKSLGDHVQAALRTIEMTMNSQNRKVPQPSTRNTYSSN